MHLIYGNAEFTLCAADDMDVRAGLKALLEDPEQRQWHANCGDGLDLILHQPPELCIGASKWNKRAWTFQERLLSKRCLIFTGGRIYVQCRSAVMSEDIFADHDGRGWSLDSVRSPLQMLSELPVRPLWFYCHCVSLYTLRELYEPFDILSAFSGMCKLIERYAHSPFIFGLPTSHFDFALLWQPTGQSWRLEEPTSSNKDKYKDKKFPSWSWCGWKSHGIKYTPDMIEGCLSDVHTWLMDHTWIDWHIRDGHGTLRRVWNNPYPIYVNHSDWNNSYPINPSVDQTIGVWQGYRGAPLPPIEERYQQDNAQILPATAEQIAYMEHMLGQLGLIAIRQHRDANTTAPLPYQWREYDGIHFYYSAKKQGDMCQQDNYGRLCGRPGMINVFTRPRVGFKLTLPEDPFHVRRASGSNHDGSSTEFPDQPFLQFFTWKTNFFVVPALSAIPPSKGIVRPGLQRCHILDHRGDKCGSIEIDAAWLRSQQQIDVMQNGATNGLDTKTDRTEFDFIAISEAKAFTIEEFPDWTYYISKERVESEWDLFFVLLVEFSEEEGFHRRVAIGKVFKTAFSFSDDQWQELILG